MNSGQHSTLTCTAISSTARHQSESGFERCVLRARWRRSGLGVLSSSCRCMCSGVGSGTPRSRATLLGSRLDGMVATSWPNSSSDRPSPRQTAHWSALSGAVENHCPPNCVIRIWHTNVLAQITQNMWLEERY